MRRTSDGRLLDRVMFALALLGVLVVVHLGIQQSRGFDQGCVGFLAPASVEGAFDCAAVLQSGAGTFLGLSNTAWGLIFYLGVALFSALLLVGKGSAVEWSARLRPILIAGGLAYTLYLVYYQFFVIEELCALCLTSAAIVLLISIIQGVSLWRSRGSAEQRRNRKPQPAPLRMKDLRFVGVLAIALVVLAGADLLYFNSLETESVASREATSASQPTAARTAQNQPVVECGFDTTKQPVTNYEEIIGMQDPYVGNADAPVTVIEFFDPNCPHCKTMHGIMKMVIEDYGDQARFVYKPVPLWDFSVQQIDALYAAAQEGKFEEMLSAQFDRQRQGGLSLRELRAIAEEIGMNPDQLSQRIERGIFRATTMQQRQIASSIGLTGVPTVLVNGRFVASTSKTSECIGRFIEEAST